MYDDFDFDDANENSKPITGLKAIELAVANIDVVAPDSSYILSTSTEFDGKGADKTTGKAVCWQMHFHKTEENKAMSRIVNVAENGCMIVRDFKEVTKIDPWKYSDATIDTDDLPGILNSHNETVSWLANHASATLDIQTSSGPFGGPKELSWIMWYKDGAESHQVYISAIDGDIIG